MRLNNIEYLNNSHMIARIICMFALLMPVLAHAQFKPKSPGEGLTIIVTDGTNASKNSPQRPPGPNNFKDPIRPLGMEEAIQAGAFLERPDYGEYGYILIFCVGDAIGGARGKLDVNGATYEGVYRLIRQKVSAEEKMPPGKTGYRLQGLVFFLGIAGS